MADRPQLTTGAGNPIADNQNYITVEKLDVRGFALKFYMEERN